MDDLHLVAAADTLLCYQLPCCIKSSSVSSSPRAHLHINHLSDESRVSASHQQMFIQTQQSQYLCWPLHVCMFCETLNTAVPYLWLQKMQRAHIFPESLRLLAHIFALPLATACFGRHSTPHHAACVLFARCCNNLLAASSHAAPSNNVLAASRHAVQIHLGVPSVYEPYSCYLWLETGFKFLEGLCSVLDLCGA